MKLTASDAWLVLRALAYDFTRPWGITACHSKVHIPCKYITSWDDAAARIRAGRCVYKTLSAAGERGAIVWTGDRWVPIGEYLNWPSH